MAIFITGATGYIGARLAMELAEQGETVHALCRSEEKAKLINHNNIKIFKGDISDVESMDAAMNGCEYIFHLAAFAKPWHKDSDMFFKLNVDATSDIIKLAEKNHIKKMVFTSTAGVLGHALNGPVDEFSDKKEGYHTDYEASKFAAEELVRETVKNSDLEIIIVNPSRLYGPGQLSESNAVSKLILQYSTGKWRFLPGTGKAKGNYAFIDDVIEGHLLALQKGKSGERYILGGENISYEDLFHRIGDVSGKQYRMFKLPMWLMLTASQIMLMLGKLRIARPLITPPWVKRYNQNWKLDLSRSVSELGYKITPFNEGVQKTLDYFKEKNNG